MGGSRGGTIESYSTTPQRQKPVQLLWGFILLFFSIWSILKLILGYVTGYTGDAFLLVQGSTGYMLVGTTFLLATYLRLEWGHLSRKHHFGFEAAAWYWHFVDVVWLFLFYWFYV